MGKNRGACIAATAVFIAICMAPVLIQTTSEIRDGEEPRVLDVFRQPPTARNLHAYEKSLEEASLVAGRCRPWMQYLQWTLLGDAGDQALIGRDGWLFYRPSVRYVAERATSARESKVEGPLPAIRSFRDQLQGMGIRLLVVPVPNKECVYPGMLARRAEGAQVIVCEPTRRLLDQLRLFGIEYVDLFEVFRNAKQADSGSAWGRLYLAHDTHWSAEGARLAAVAVARQVLDSEPALRGTHAYVERPVTVWRAGDLVQMLNVPWIERSIEPERVACLQVVQFDTGAPYRDAEESDVLVLGDSFLRIFERDEPGSAGFIAHLAREFRQPLTAIVNDGGATTVVRQRLARRPSLLRNKKLVIWEFAEREIGQGPEQWRIVPLAAPQTAPK